VLVFAVAISVGLGAPLAVIQILVVNLLTDGLPALALARDPAAPETMQTPPRPGQQLFDRATWRFLLWVGVLVGAVTFAAFAIGRARTGDAEQTMAFATLALSELALVYGMRSRTAAAWRLPSNTWLNLSVLVSVLFVIAAVYVPGVDGVFATVPLDPIDAATVSLLALVPLAAIELVKSRSRRSQKGEWS